MSTKNKNNKPPLLSPPRLTTQEDYFLQNNNRQPEKQIKKKINEDSEAINRNEGNNITTDSEDSTKTKTAPNKGIARKNYGTMFYPSFIQKSDQDKLKITILEFSSRLEGGKKTGNFKLTQTV